MANIYANSTITIAASASSGPSEGLFRVADPKHIGRPTSSFPHIHTRYPLGHHSPDLPLLGRGWVFQERLLSPRVLHFAEHELIWECMESLDCECLGIEDDPDGEKNSWPIPKQSCHPGTWRSLKDDHVEITAMWHMLTRSYSKLVLSKPDDIFPAISGIAKSFGEATGWNYFAGMWKQIMIPCLSWYISPQSSRTRCVPWRAPTFSWASVQFVEAPNFVHLKKATEFGVDYPEGERLDE